MWLVSGPDIWRSERGIADRRCEEAGMVKKWRRLYWVYILGSRRGTLYTGMTGNLKNRIHQHKQETNRSFT